MYQCLCNKFNSNLSDYSSVILPCQLVFIGAIYCKDRTTTTWEKVFANATQNKKGHDY